MLNRQTIETLLRKHLRDELTQAEREQLRLELLNGEQQDNWKAVIHQLHTEAYNSPQYDPKITEEIVNSILTEYPAQQTPVIPIQKRNTGRLRNPASLKLRWARYAAAILIILGLGAYLWNITKKENPASTAVASAKADKNDILPGSEKAILTLSNGKKVELNSSASEVITDGKLSIKNNNGQLIYGSNGPLSPFEKGGRSDVPGGETAGGFMNTMSTPRGGQYQLTLSDGTKVRLNAASSITYPTTFTGHTREVKITGEAYFEVAQNKSVPFIVKTISEDIKVLGTLFNVKSYSDEPYSKTTLVTGAVKINDQLLQPGQAYTKGKIVTTNIQQDIAWINGGFDFNGQDLKTVMNQLARWYDVTISYESTVPSIEFYGTMERNLTLQQVLKAMSAMGLKFRFENKHLIILP